LRYQNRLLKTTQSRDRAILHIAVYPDPLIYQFLVERCDVVVPKRIFTAIFFNKQVSANHRKLADKCAEIASYNQGKTGMRQIALLHNSTNNVIPIDNFYVECNVRVLCANNCIIPIRTLTINSNYHHMLFGCYSELLSIAARFTYHELLQLLLNFGERHLSQHELLTCAKRAVQLCITYREIRQYDRVRAMLAKYCSDRDAVIGHLFYNDAQYYWNASALINAAIAESVDCYKFAVLVYAMRSDLDGLKHFLHKYEDKLKSYISLDGLLLYCAQSGLTKSSQCILDIMEARDELINADILSEIRAVCVKDCNADLLQSIIDSKCSAHLQHTLCKKAIANMRKAYG
jgi:hypothetical protein